MTQHDPQRFEIPLLWIGYEDTPIAYANQFLIQWQVDGSFVFGIGQATAPALIGSRESIEQQAAQITSIPVHTLFRVGFTRAKLEELVAALQANLVGADEALALMRQQEKDAKDA